MLPRIVADRLYGLSMRPQELALYAERGEVSLRYRPIFEDPNEITDRHYKLLVLEISVTLDPDDALGAETPGPLQLVKCGWELELTTEAPCRVGTLAELPDEMPRLLGQVALTINDLAQRAHLEHPPLGADLITSLIAQYQTQAQGGSGSTP